MLIATVALAATACSKATGTGPQAGGAYGAQATEASSMPATDGAMSGAVQTAALKVEHTSAGMVLADGKGLTLYYFTRDKRDSGTSVCTGGCASAWPPLTTPVKAPAGVRLPGPLGMITRAGGVKQVTVNGFPVYYYAEDKTPGQVTGNGAGGTWHVIKVKKTSASTGAMATPSTKPTAPARGYGY